MKQISIPGLTNHDVAGIIFNTTHDSMFIMQIEPDDEFRCIEVNKAYLHNTRLKPEQVIGKTLKEILPEKAYQTAYNGYKKAIETRQSVQYLEKVDFGFGEDVVETTITPVFDASGICTLLIGASRDIKKEKETEKVLAETEERYRLLAEHASDSITLYDKDHKILYLSPSTEKLSGYSITEIINHPFLTMVHKDDIEPLKKKIALANQNKLKHQIYEYRYKRKDGQYIWIETNSTRIYDLDGNLFRIVTVHRDITLRKNIEEQLRFHSMILDQIQDRVTVTDLQGNITYVNKAVQQMFEKESNEFIGKSVKSYGENPEKGATQQEIIDKTLENGAWSGEIVNLAPDGTEHFMNVRTRILKNLNGEPIGMCGISTDITEQKKQEAIIKESEKRYQSLFDNMTDGFSLNKIITDDNGKPVDWQFLMVNPAHEKQTGLKQEETIGKTIREIFPDIEQEWIDFYGQVALSGKSGKKISFNKNTGKYYEVNAFCPSPGNFAVVVNNITERIEAEKQLIQAKEKAEEDETKIRSMFENTLTGIMFATPEGKILEANPAMLKIVGSPSLEVSKQLNLLEHEPLKQIGFADNLRKCILQKTVVSAETQYTSRFGKITYLNYFLIPIFVNEKNLGVWVNVHDLTDLWSVRNDLLVAKEKTEAADRLKTAFLNNISHEVRTPLNGILGFGELITQPGLSPQKKEEYLNILNYSSNRLMQTITDYMDISLLTSGNQEVFIETLVPAELINECFHDFYEKCTDKNLKLFTSFPENAENDTLLSDKNLLIKSLSHLIENAIKFSNQGDIIIGYRRTELGLDFFVSDMGIGISKAMVNRVFDNFIQEDLSTTRGHEGSGLGLSIVREIAHLLKGSIQVESEKGKGSTFTLSIPQKVIHNIPKNKPGDNRPLVKNEFVLLIVEDDQSIFDFFDAILSPYQLTVFKAYNGEEAIVLCKEHPEINLILMDLKMPVMNGFEATSIIKQMRPELPVIAQTAYALSGDEHRAIEAGCDDYITKPFRKKHLIEKMKKFGFDEERFMK